MIVDRKPARYDGRPDTVLALVLDCADLARAAEFWCAALGYVRQGPSPDEESVYCQLIPADGDGVELLLQKTVERKAAKNRMHIDLRHPDLEAETARLLNAGARHTTGDLVQEDGWAWYVLTDPDGNEFCVLRPPTP